VNLRFDLKEEIIRKICEVLSYYSQVGKAILYGSRAKGNCKTGSDVDLTLLGGKELMLEVMGLIMERFYSLSINGYR
jgi:uncharacterized protein